MKVLHSILLVRRYKEIDVFINNVAKMSHIYVLEIYFVDYYDGALHYYFITALSSLCHYVSMSLCHYVRVIWGPHFIVKFCPERVAE